MRWYEAAAAQGDPEARAWLGQSYMFGRGVARDPGKAIAIFQMLVKDEEPLGYLHLGTSYLDGWGVPKDEKKGAELALKAAEMDDYVGQRTIAECYLLQPQRHCGQQGSIDPDADSNPYQGDLGAKHWTKTVPREESPFPRPCVRQPYLSTALTPKANPSTERLIQQPPIAALPPAQSPCHKVITRIRKAGTPTKSGSLPLQKTRAPAKKQLVIPTADRQHPPVEIPATPTISPRNAPADFLMAASPATSALRRRSVSNLP